MKKIDYCIEYLSDNQIEENKLYYIFHITDYIFFILFKINVIYCENTLLNYMLIKSNPINIRILNESEIDRLYYSFKILNIINRFKILKYFIILFYFPLKIIYKISLYFFNTIIN